MILGFVEVKSLEQYHAWGRDTGNRTVSRSWLKGYIIKLAHNFRIPQELFKSQNACS